MDLHRGVHGSRQQRRVCQVGNESTHVARVVSRFYGERGCWLLDTPYPRVSVDGNGIQLSRLLFRYLHGYLPEVVRHTCDDPRCVNPRHLKGGTQSDNIRDRDERGRTARGKRHGKSKLTEDDVVEMRRLRDQGWTLERLGEKFGVTKTNVSFIVRRITWTHC